MIAVTGSTGNVGGAVVRALLAKGRQVRALVRDEAKGKALAEMGAELFVASVEDGSQMEAAFDGTEGVFVMTPPLLQSVNPREEHRLALAAIAHALQASHTPKVVFLSSVGSQHAEGTGAILKTHDMEETLFGLSIDAASVRAAYFMENLLPLAAHVKESGQLPVVLEPMDKTFPMVATPDIGQVAADLLAERWSGRRIVELEGPRRYSMADAAKAYSEVLGRSVEAMLVPAAGRQAMFEQFGMTPGASATMVEMANGFNSGLVDFEGGDRTEHRRGTTALENVLRGKQ